MAVETTSKNLRSDASATGGGSLPETDGELQSLRAAELQTGGAAASREKKRGRPGQVAVRVLYLPFVQVFLDEAVATQHGLEPGVAAVLSRVTEALETQWQRDLGRSAAAGGKTYEAELQELCGSERRRMIQHVELLALGPGATQNNLATQDGPPSQEKQHEHTMSPNFDKLRQILVEQLGVHTDQVTLNAKLEEDLGADSLDLVEAIMAIEEEFGIVIPDDDADTMWRKGGTVALLVEYLDQNAE